MSEPLKLKTSIITQWQNLKVVSGYKVDNIFRSLDLLKEPACVKIGQELWEVDATTKKLDVA